MKKSISNLKSKKLGSFKSVFGGYADGGCTTYTIATVVITKPKETMSLMDSCPEDVNCPNDGNDC